MSTTTRLFFDAVAPHVDRVVVVNSSEFDVIRKSVKKTDKNDAETLALFLSKGLLPEVRMKDKLHAELASLTQTRDTLVKQRLPHDVQIGHVIHRDYVRSSHRWGGHLTSSVTRDLAATTHVVWRRRARQPIRLARAGTGLELPQHDIIHRESDAADGNGRPGSPGQPQHNA